MIETAWKKCGERADPTSPGSGPYTIHNIVTPLTPIQFATLGWMLQREVINSLKRGGVVAHDMGMGKTLMALAIMVMNKIGLDRRKKNDCSTLVVVPSEAVVNHWIEECIKHAPDFFQRATLVRYKDTKRGQTVEGLRSFQIV